MERHRLFIHFRSPNVLKKRIFSLRRDIKIINVLVGMSKKTRQFPESISDEELQIRLTHAKSMLMAKYEDLVSRKTQIHEEIRDSKKAIQSLKSQIQGFTSKRQPDLNLAQTQAGLEEEERSSRENAEKLMELRSLCEKGVVKLCEERKERVKTEAKKKEVTADLAKVTETVKSLESTPSPDTLTRELKAKLRQQKINMENKLTILETEIVTLKDELKQAEEREEADSKAVAEKNVLISELEGRIQRRDDTQDELENRLRLACAEHEQASKEQKDLQDQIATLTKGIENLEIVRTRIQAERADIAKSCDQEKHKTSDLTKKARTAAERFQKQLEEVRLDIHQRCRVAVEAAEASISEKQATIDEYRQEIEKYEKSKHETEIRIRDIENEIDLEKNRFKKTQQTYQVRFEAMTKLLGTFSFEGREWPNEAEICD
jgi:chromosome segregation ATPase